MPNSKNDVQIDLAIPALDATNKKQLFEQLSNKAAPICGLDAHDLYNCFINKEIQAGSGVGNGVAIPHMKLKRLQKPCTIIAYLKNPLNFDAYDDLPVTLVCAVLSPENQGQLHLQRLSRISRLLRHKTLRTRLHEANDIHEINTMIMASNSWKIAA